MRFALPIFLIFSLVITFSQGWGQEKFDTDRWKKLMTLIDSEIKTIKGNRYSGPELKHRLFELYSEKIKLIKEKENLTLLKTDANIVLKNGKESFFKSSQEQYKNAQTYAISIITQYPTYTKLSEIYYALAINSRDYGTSSETERFLKLSISKSTEKSKNMFNAKTALAEHYYNNKNYHEAISYYDDVLENTQDEWYGKHLYNSGWCHLKERNFKRALELLKQAFATTKNPKYISMKEQVFAAIGIFFVQADVTMEGIEFFEKNSIPASFHLLGLAQSSMNKNNFSLTEEVLKAALKDGQKRQDPNAEMKVRLAQLSIYRESKKDQLYFEVANNILELSKKYKLEPDDLFLAQNKIKEVAGFMQVNLIKDKTKENVEYNKEDYKKIIRYFDILAMIDQSHKTQYRYYQGETALSTQDYSTALKYYLRAIKNSKRTKDSGEITRKSLDAMLATLELAKLPKEINDAYTIFAFKNFVIFYPQSEKSQVIYQKLFNKYFEDNEIKKALNALFVYQYYYKIDEAIHREMLTQIIDFYIKEKNTDKIAFWIGKIEKGYLHFTTDYIQNSIAALGELLFNKYQALEKNGQIKEAIKGYESIYDSKQYPQRTKAEAAYAIAALLLEQNKSKESKKWLGKSLEIYESKDLIKISASLLVLAKGHRLLQNVELSSEVALMVSRRFCSENFAEKESFYQLIMENTLLQKLTLATLLDQENEFKKCGISDAFQAKCQTEILTKLLGNNRYQDALIYFKTYAKNSHFASLLSRSLKSRFYQNPHALKKDLESLTNDKTIDFSPVLTQYQKVLDFKGKIESLRFIFTSEEKFNEDKYNQELEQHFALVGDLQSEAIELSKTLEKEEIIALQNIRSKPYFSLVKSIQDFLPQGVEKKYLEGFQQGMRQITESLLAKGLQIDKEKMAFLNKNNYFLEIQKNDIFTEEKVKTKKTPEQELHFHFALLFSNTLDMSPINDNRMAIGQ